MFSRNQFKAIMAELQKQTELMQANNQLLQTMLEVEVLGHEANESLIKGLLDQEPKIERNVRVQEEQFSRMLQDHTLDE